MDLRIRDTAILVWTPHGLSKTARHRWHEMKYQLVLRDRAQLRKENATLRADRDRWRGSLTKMKCESPVPDGKCVNYEEEKCEGWACECKKDALECEEWEPALIDCGKCDCCLAQKAEGGNG